MTDHRESLRNNAPHKSGADKRADALRENLKKRKAQQSARQNLAQNPDNALTEKSKDDTQHS